MSAKPGRKPARPAAAGKSTVPAVPPSVAPAGGGDVAAGDAVAWIDSPDPRRRQLGRFLLAGVWVYVAALWLLALDQTFDWGVF